MAAIAILASGGCGEEDPVAPVAAGTDYDFVVVNETATDFVVYRQGSINGHVWEPMGPLGALGAVSYRSEVGATYVLVFCLEGDGPEESRAGVNYGFRSTDTQTWILRKRYVDR